MPRPLRYLLPCEWVDLEIAIFVQVRVVRLPTRALHVWNVNGFDLSGLQFLVREFHWLQTEKRGETGYEMRHNLSNPKIQKYSKVTIGDGERQRKYREEYQRRTMFGLSSPAARPTM